ncbi:TetR/AcrR family transcriptional regulator [Kutzneria buriramensis]|uniref:AcrR family transcriptional regulator n=1 Tax=Kutzneria buriramensis TaxID=1045776 RepID=A0A3E0H4S9_9PSEU|nr:TetR/AcrR family transcriptional regulator [Kutzneria buriramensis]REH37177.1 AcrR family transcriptional regulator [Kutzneria buriramensis]
MPTGVHIQDARAQLFDAAERVLLREGPHALTSRAVTTEAGVAKGVLHRHFPDFDGFLTELVLDRIARLPSLGPEPGVGEIVDNLTEFLSAVFTSVAVSIVALITFRDDLRRRLRAVRGPGVPLASEAGALLRQYLRDERELGRLAADADIDTVAPTLIGAGHLIFADRESGPPSEDAVRRMVRTVLAGATTDR